MTLQRFVTTSLIASVITGCASVTPSRLDYTPPSGNPKVDNQVTINEGFSVVWDRLVANLSSSYFVINNIDKESRLINVSFSTDSPEDYIDCGTSTRDFNFQNESQRYSYPLASNSTFKSLNKWGPYKNLPVVISVQRNTELEGRLNIYIAPETQNSSLIKVNARYIFSVGTQMNATAYSAFLTPVGQESKTEPATKLTFNTGEKGSKTTPIGTMICISTGKLEKNLLDMANG